MSRHLYFSIIQKLTQRKLIKLDRIKSPKQVSVSYLEESTSILNELEYAEKNFIQAQFANFTDEEKEKYQELSDKIKNNIQSIFS